MNIWVPKGKILEPKQEVLLHTSMEAWFKMEATNVRTGKKRFLAEFPNLITDAGLNFMGSNSGWLNSCRVGTGNTAPSVGDTNLVAQVAGTSTDISSSNNAQPEPPYYGYTTKTWRFSEGEAAGNLAEVGIATSTGSGTGTLWSRALILDGGGSPTTITVLSDEYLDVTYQLRVKPPLTDVVTSFDLNGVPNAVTIRAADVTSGVWAPGGGFGTGGIGGISTNGQGANVYNGVIGPITGNPAGASDTVTSVSNSAYSAGSFQREAIATYGLTDGNLAGGIKSCRILLGGIGSASGTFGYMQMEFGTAIPKTSGEILTLTFRHTWARGTP